MTVLSDTRERFVRAMVAQMPVERIAEVHFFSSMKQGGVESGVAVVAAWGTGEAHAPEERPTVYTARYRLTLKGPDRGKWETSIVAEAEAPLVTVEAVVRGVQRRSGDVEDPVRLTGDELRAAIAASDAARTSVASPARAERA